MIWVIIWLILFGFVGPYTASAVVLVALVIFGIALVFID